MTNMISWIKGIPEAEMYNHVSYKIMLCILRKPRGLCATAETGFQTDSSEPRCDWPTFSQSFPDWLRAPFSQNQLEIPPQS